LDRERAESVRQENDYQQTISSLQKKIAEMIKQHSKAMEEVKRELQHERLNTQKQLNARPISVPEFVQVSVERSSSSMDRRSIYRRI
jgi:hypothetical protein